MFYDQCERPCPHRPGARQRFAPLKGSHGCSYEEVAHKRTDHWGLEIAYRAEQFDCKLDTLHFAGTLSLCFTEHSHLKARANERPRTAASLVNGSRQKEGENILAVHGLLASTLEQAGIGGAFQRKDRRDEPTLAIRDCRIHSWVRRCTERSTQANTVMVATRDQA